MSQCMCTTHALLCTQYTPAADFVITTGMLLLIEDFLGMCSGGKDSCYNMLLCQQHGHEIIALANLLPAAPGVDELDSYMFQTVGHNVIPHYAECMGLPLYRRHISGSSVHQARH